MYEFGLGEDSLSVLRHFDKLRAQNAGWYYSAIGTSYAPAPIVEGDRPVRGEN
jgi:hypothetical protein